MSRYVCHYAVNCAPALVQPTLHHLLAACQLEPIHETEDFIVAREIPGRIPFARLVKVEVLLDVTHASTEWLKLSFVFKNEELPLNSNNHCRQLFDLLRQTIYRDERWQPIANLHDNRRSTPVQPYLDLATKDMSSSLDPQWSASVN